MHTSLTVLVKQSVDWVIKPILINGRLVSQYIIQEENLITLPAAIQQMLG